MKISIKKTIENKKYRINIENIVYEEEEGYPKIFINASSLQSLTFNLNDELSKKINHALEDGAYQFLLLLISSTDFNPSTVPLEKWNAWFYLFVEAEIIEIKPEAKEFYEFCKLFI